MHTVLRWDFLFFLGQCPACSNNEWHHPFWTLYIWGSSCVLCDWYATFIDTLQCHSLSPILLAITMPILSPFPKHQFFEGKKGWKMNVEFDCTVWDPSSSACQTSVFYHLAIQTYKETKVKENISYLIQLMQRLALLSFEVPSRHL